MHSKPHSHQGSTCPTPPPSDFENFFIAPATWLASLCIPSATESSLPTCPAKEKFRGKSSSPYISLCLLLPGLSHPGTALYWDFSPEAAFFLLVQSLKRQIILEASLVAQMVKCLPTIRETRVQSLGWEDLEKAMAPHSSTLAWKTPWMEEPGGLQSTGSQRVGHD